MSYLRERVSYLKGLAEGMNVGTETSEGKLLHAIIGVLDEFALVIEEMDEIQDDFNDQLEALDDSVAQIEKELFDIDYDADEDNEESDDEEPIEIECPYCGKTVIIDDEWLASEEDTLECPHCHKSIEVEWECDCCDHDHDDCQDDNGDEE